VATVSPGGAGVLVGEARLFAHGAGGRAD
jgi:hypothetical protein